MDIWAANSKPANPHQPSLLPRQTSCLFLWSCECFLHDVFLSFEEEKSKKKKVNRFLEGHLPKWGQSSWKVFRSTDGGHFDWEIQAPGRDDVSKSGSKMMSPWQLSIPPYAPNPLSASPCHRKLLGSHHFLVYAIGASRPWPWTHCSSPTWSAFFTIAPTPALKGSRFPQPPPRLWESRSTLSGYWSSYFATYPSLNSNSMKKILRFPSCFPSRLLHIPSAINSACWDLQFFSQLPQAFCKAPVPLCAPSAESFANTNCCTYQVSDVTCPAGSQCLYWSCPAFCCSAFIGTRVCASLHLLCGCQRSFFSWLFCFTC